MAIHDQWLKNVCFCKIKNLLNCNIDFDNTITGILGVNGSGKSTILHVLACIYKPTASYRSINYKFSDFFTPNTHSKWNDSRILVSDTYKDNGTAKTRNEVPFYKHNRWAPKYDRRIERCVIFIGIKTCVPSIETETKTGRINFIKSVNLSSDNDEKVRTYASYILDKPYEELNNHKAQHKSYIGVKYNSIQYCSLSMGAGEQRVFLILQQIIAAPKSSLILIDEIDLLLHKNALEKLLEKIIEIAKEKKMQVVFTTHNHSILELKDISFKHILQTGAQTLCLENANPDIIYKLTGEQLKPITVYVEDDLSYAIIEFLAGVVGIRRNMSIEKFGAAQNAFICAAGLALMHKDMTNVFFILDGDVNRSSGEKDTQLKKYITGTEPETNQLRIDVRNRILQYDIPDGAQPEKYIVELITELDQAMLSNEHVEYVQVAKSIGVVLDKHDYVNNIFRIMSVDKKVGLNNIINILSQHSKWNEITSEIKTAFENKKAELNL